MTQASPKAPPGISVWVIFDRPPGFPHTYVARQQIAKENGVFDTGQIIVGPGTEAGLNMMREFLAHHGMVPVARDESDHPKIVETWL